MANSFGNHQEWSLNGASAPDTSATALTMKHNPDTSLDWTPEEQAVLEEGLSQYASETNIRRYAKIAIRLSNKTIRDVALRVRWMNEKFYDHAAKSSQEKIYDHAAKSSQFAAQLGASSYAPTMMMMDNDDSIFHNAIGVPTGELLEQNEEVLSQISANFDACNLQDNIKLFCQTTNNIDMILNDLEVAEVLRQMPPLPYMLNERTSNSILPGINHQMQQ